MSDEKLKIIELKTYMCPICHVPYASLKKAKKCRDKGLIGEGPVIKPGLVVKGIFDEVYSVFYREFQKMHYRYDEFINFKKRENLERISPLELEGNLKRDYIDNIKHQITLLNESEFKEFKMLVKRDIDFKKLGLDAEDALKNLYRYHEFFDLANKR